MKVGAIIAIVAVVLFSLLFGSCAMYFHGTEKEVVIKKVEDSPSGQSHQMLIQTTDGDWFKVGDSLFRWQFRSRDVWGEFEVGKSYTIHYDGWRIGLFSSYPNVYQAESK